MKNRTVQLADIVESVNPGFASGENTIDGVVQLRMNNVNTDGTLDWSSLRRVPADERKVRKYALQPGDIAFNSTNSPELVGKTALFSGFKEPVVFSNHFLRVRVNQSAADPGFVAWWLNFRWQQREFESLCTRWVNQASVRKDDLLDLHLDLPPLSEQRRIAGQLEQADRLRRTRRYALELSDTFLPAAFLQLFGGATSQIRRWPHESLSTLIRTDDKINYGVVQPGTEISAGVPIVRVADMDDLESSLPHLKRIAPEIDKQHSASRLNGDEILIACVGATLGKIAAARPTMKGFNIARAVARVPGDWRRLHPAFLTHHLLSPRVQSFWKKETRTVGQPTLNIRQIEETPVVLPPLPLQQQFASLAARHERLRLVQREALRQAEHLFQSLLHQAFTPET